MTKKEKLATEYLELKKKFDGSDFKENITENQMWYLTSEFKVVDLEYKIEAMKNAIKDKELRLKREAYYATPEGKAYKEEIERKISELRDTWKNTHDTFENWIISTVNEMVPGNWTARLSLGSYMSGNVEIGLVNRDPERKEKGFETQFGHDFTIYFDGYNFGKKTPRFELNYGTLGAFDLFNDETRPLYLNGLAKISNDKEFLQLLMSKFIESCIKIKNLSIERDEYKKLLDNPNF